MNTTKTLECKVCGKGYALREPDPAPMTLLDMVKGMKRGHSLRRIGQQHVPLFVICCRGQHGERYQWDKWTSRGGYVLGGKGTAEEAAAALEQFLKGKVNR